MAAPATTTTAPLRRALALLGVVGLLLAIVESVLAARAAAEQVALAAAYPMVGAAFVVVGCLAWSRRPRNAIGALLCLTGALILGSALADGGLPEPLAMLGLLLGELPIAATLHVVLAFPSGRVPTRLDRRLVVGLYGLVLLRQLPVALPGPDLEPLRDLCSYAGGAIILAAVVRLVLRVRREGPGTRERRVLVAVYAYGGGLLVFFFVSARVLTPLLDLDRATLIAAQVAAFALLPFVFAAGVVRGFARTGELDELATWLGEVGDAGSLREVLAQVLGDPSLQVLHDGDGRVEERAGRGVVRVRGADGQDTGVSLSFDSLLLADSRPVEQAARVVALALERERLRADLLGERAALRASRARVVEEGDRRRRELGQDMHDLLQSRLTLAALHVGRLAVDAGDEQTRRGLAELRDELDALITEFRGVVHGVMPALLLERGLAAAAEDLVDRLPVPARLELDGADDLPPLVATNAYFILAEALTNAVRHSRAGEITVHVAQRGDRLHLVVTDDGMGGAEPTGAGLRGIADRVAALDGTLHVASPPEGGTRVEAVVRCGS